MSRAPSDAVRHERRNMLWGGAALASAFTALDVVYMGHAVPEALAARAAWVLSLAVGGLMVTRGGAGMFTWSLRGVAISSVVIYPFIGWYLGGFAKPLFSWMLVMPLAAAVIAQEEIVGTVITGVGSMAGVAILGLIAGEPGLSVAMWTAVTASSAGMGVLGSWQYRNRVETERRAVEALGESERRRAQAERLALVGQLASGVAHEVNNPLAFVKSNLEYVGQEIATLDSRADLAMALSEAQVGVERIRRVVADLRVFSREEKGEAEPSDVREVVEEALRLAGIRFKNVIHPEVDLPAGLPRAAISHQHLSQVMVNLLVNAADAFDGPDPPRSPKVWIHAARDGRWLRVMVEDNGPGLSVLALAHLFEPFFTTKDPGKGTGLGLALTRELVEQVGGSVSAQNREEGGARFLVRLPCA